MKYEIEYKNVLIAESEKHVELTPANKLQRFVRSYKYFSLDGKMIFEKLQNIRIIGLKPTGLRTNDVCIGRTKITEFNLLPSY